GCCPAAPTTRSSAASTGCPADSGPPQPILGPVRPRVLSPGSADVPVYRFTSRSPSTRIRKRAGGLTAGRGPPASGEGDRMVGMLAIAAAAGWLLAFSLCAVMTSLLPRWAGAAALWPGRAGERAALVNL